MASWVGRDNTYSLGPIVCGASQGGIQGLYTDTRHIFACEHSLVPPVITRV